MDICKGAMESHMMTCKIAARSVRNLNDEAQSIWPSTTSTPMTVAHNVPVTFRAAGTSLSGQAIGEGILLILGHDGFRNIEISEDRNSITLGAAVIGSDANMAFLRIVF